MADMDTHSTSSPSYGRATETHPDETTHNRLKNGRVIRLSDLQKTKRERKFLHDELRHEKWYQHGGAQFRYGIVPSNKHTASLFAIRPSGEQFKYLLNNKNYQWKCANPICNVWMQQPLKTGCPVSHVDDCAKMWDPIHYEECVIRWAIFMTTAYQSPTDAEKKKDDSKNDSTDEFEDDSDVVDTEPLYRTFLRLVGQGGDLLQREKTVNMKKIQAFATRIFKIKSKEPEKFGHLLKQATLRMDSIRKLNVAIAEMASVEKETLKRRTDDVQQKVFYIYIII
jgi:hypothetical protein